jgi:diketogulonate reductase-like aldo/keto reductase
MKISTGKMNPPKNKIILNTGAATPIVGLGTWNIHPEKVGEVVEYAILECGYRHIDCAFVYHNEKEVGQSLKKVFDSKKVKRDQIFITSKLWSTAHRKEAVLAACKQTLKDLQLDYLDLYLMHFPIAIWPGGGDEPLDKNGYVLTEKVSIQETWEAMQGLVTLGLVKAIGVSNFSATPLLDLLSYAKIIPAVNQIELHPYLLQQSFVDFCQYKNIVITAYSPLGSYEVSKDKNKPILLKDKTINIIAKKYKKSPAQILIRFAIQRNIVVIPKSATPKHIKANIDVFDFELSKKDMEVIKSLDRKLHFVDPEEWWGIPFFN